MNLSPIDDDELPSPPQQSWGAILASAVLLTTLLIGGAELACREPHAERPDELQDDAQFWTRTRAKLRESDARQVILLGDSRMQCDVATDVLGAELGRDAPLQLACGGATPIPALRHIAEQSKFKGVVLCNVIPYFFFNQQFFSGGAQQTYIDAWQANKPSCLLLQSVSLARNDLASRRRIAELRFGVASSPVDQVAADRYWKVLPDRSIATDFSRAGDLSKLCAAWTAGVNSCPDPPISETELVAEFDQYERWVKLIQARGGQVIFLRLPVSGMVLEGEERKFPREKYWRHFVASSTATFVDFADFPSLADFTCPDGSHLDAHEREPFSKALAAVLKDKIRQP